MSIFTSAWESIRRNVRPLRYYHFDLAAEKKDEADLAFERGATKHPKDRNRHIIWLKTFSPSLFNPNYDPNKVSRNPEYGYHKSDHTSLFKKMGTVLRFILILPQNIAKYFFEYLPHRAERWCRDKIDNCRKWMFDLSIKRHIAQVVHERNKAGQESGPRQAGAPAPAAAEAHLVSHPSLRQPMHPQAVEPSSSVPSVWREIGVGALIAGLSIFYYAFKAIRYAARAGLSPVNHIKAGWEAGYKTQQVEVREEIVLKIPKPLCLADADNRLVISEDGGKTYWVIAGQGQEAKEAAKTLYLHENGEFRINGLVNPIDASEVRPYVAAATELSTPEFIEVKCIRFHRKDVLVDKQGNFIDEQGYVLKKNSADDLSSTGDQPFLRMIEGKAARAGDSRSTPDWTWKSVIYAGFNFLVSAALLIVTFKYLASSAISWVAGKVGGFVASALGTIESVSLSGTVSTTIELCAAAAVVGRTPGVISDIGDACFPKGCRGSHADNSSYLELDSQRRLDNRAVAGATDAATQGSSRAQHAVAHANGSGFQAPAAEEESQAQQQQQQGYYDYPY